MSDIENLIKSWKVLTLSLSEYLKNTDIYKELIKWRIDNQKLRDEYVLLKELIRQYEKDKTEYEKYKKLCDDLLENKPIHYLKYYEDETKEVNINDVKERFHRIKQEFFVFIVPFQLKLRKWFGITLELSEMLIISEEQKFL